MSVYGEFGFSGATGSPFDVRGSTEPRACREALRRLAAYLKVDAVGLVLPQNAGTNAIVSANDADIGIEEIMAAATPLSAEQSEFDLQVILTETDAAGRVFSMVIVARHERRWVERLTQVARYVLRALISELENKAH